jgi:excinuclease ABC subunit A
MHPTITVRNAHLHNLRHVTVEIPRGRLVALTGVSGSGKSTLAFDILHQESLRQYLEALGLLSWGLSRPPVEAISGLPPSVSVGPYATPQNPRSTVGTATEISTYLRVLYARLGHRPCPACGTDVPPPLLGQPAEGWQDAGDGPLAAEAAADEPPAGTVPCPHCGAALAELGMADFSFNKPAGACPTCTGLGVVRQAIVGRLIDEAKSIPAGAVAGWLPFHIARNCRILESAAAHYGLPFDPALPVAEYAPAARDLLLYGTGDPRFRRHFAGLRPPATSAEGRFEGLVTNLERRYAEHAENAAYRRRLDRLFTALPCPDCAGTRLRPESRAVTVAGEPLPALSGLALTDLAGWLAALPDRLPADEARAAGPILAELGERLGRVLRLGVGYLALERSAPTLSAGEAHRLRLATLLGATLTGVLYVLDEPTIGLHQRDTQRLIGVLRALRDAGNTVLVVEHDLELIRAADQVIDLGPGGGAQGGRIVAIGTPAEVAGAPGSITGAYLAGAARAALPVTRRAPGPAALTIHGARAHNLRNLTVRIPLGLLVAVTGVSGAGKSALVGDVLGLAARERLEGGAEPPGAHDAISGWEHLDRVICIDQRAIGRVPRSNVATYAEAFTPIRGAFAATPEAQAAGLTARHFSFNVPGGRCERCEGSGTLAIPMHFLPDVEVRCPACHGRRFQARTLAIAYRGHDIAEVLEMTVAEALEEFAGVGAAAARLGLLADVGLGYLRLGQPATTLSGGEAQRVKLARALGRRGAGRTLYLLDEPTTGLHPADTARLVEVLRRLVAAGHSVVVVEHNLDVIAAADWVIDLGPEGGEGGGRLVAEGPPEEVARAAGSHTGRYLRAALGMGGEERQD